MRIKTYAEVRESMSEGDVLLFSGEGFVSSLVRWATRSNLSHAGLITYWPDWVSKRKRVMVTDSTQIGGRLGVATRPLSELLATYQGCVWWLPLSQDCRSRVNERALQLYLRQAQRLKYDLAGCVRAGFRAVFRRNLAPVGESERRVFCSEFAAFALEHAGVHDFPNCSLVTPADLAFAGLYRGVYQLAGDPERIWRKRDGRRELLEVRSGSPVHR
jgi:hypothetical protein